MKRILSTFKTYAAAMALCAVTLFGTTFAFAADKVTMKDGTVYEGEIVREGDSFLYIKVKVGAIEREQFVTKDQVTKIERESDTAPKTGDAATTPTGGASSDAKAGDKPASGATRVAFLNFGPPAEWNGAVGDMVGGTISAKAWDDAVPLLEKDKVDVVVVVINSGGGALMELERFHKVFEEKYKKKFRTVAWVESAISAAAMSPWVLEEFYMMPNGNIGACTGWYGPLIAMKGIELEFVLRMMAEASRLAGRDPKIMRSMQILEPLSADVDPDTGKVSWYQDTTSGKYLVNDAVRILTFNASDAVKFKFAKAIAETKDELVKAMGINEWEEAGKQATDFINNHMKTADQTEKRFREVVQKYITAIEFAQGAQDDEQRGAQVGRARKFLAEMRRAVKVNPNFVYFLADQVGRPLDDEFFREQEEMLDELAAGGRR
jgi:hypothetical protein